MIIRNITKTLVLAVLLGLSTVASATDKIGVVNVLRLASTAPQAELARTQIQAEFGGRDRELKARQEELLAQDEQIQTRLRRDTLGMTAAQAQQLSDELTRERRALQRAAEDLQRDAEDLQTEARAREQQMGYDIQRKILAHVTKYAQDNGYDLVIGDGVIYATPAVDITDAVLSQMTAEFNAER